MKKEIRQVDKEREICRLHFSGASKVCHECGARFFRKSTCPMATWVKQRYCSLACYGHAPDQSIPTVKQCTKCGAEFHRKRGCGGDKDWMGQRFCSPECAKSECSNIRIGQWSDPKYRKAMSDAHSGPRLHLRGIPKPYMAGVNNPRWKGGITPENRRIRTSLAYKQWRRAVLSRDKNTCVECGASGCELHVDHIKPFAKYPELRLEVSNGRVLCRACHQATPTYSSRRS